MYTEVKDYQDRYQKFSSQKLNDLLVWANFSSAIREYNITGGSQNTLWKNKKHKSLKKLPCAA